MANSRVSEGENVSVAADVREVSVDVKKSEVLKWDESGVRLQFDETPGRFLDLGKDAEKLSYWNKGAYFLAKNANQKAIEEQEEPSFLKGVEVIQAATATEQLQVDYPVGFRRKWHPAWKRPDEVRRAMREGYVVASDSDVQTYANRVGTTPTVGQKGNEELVLMKIPLAQKMARTKAAVEKSRRRVAGVEATTREQLQAGGGLPLPEAEEASERGWSEAYSREE